MSGPVEGRLEAVVDGRAIGWAWDPDEPDQAVEVEVEVDGEPAGSGVAAIERPVLAEAGVGTGRYGFDIELPEELGAQEFHTIRLRAGSERTPVIPVETFETVVRVEDGPWKGTTFAAEGGPSVVVPFVPEEEEPPDPGEAALVGKDGWLFPGDVEKLSPAQLRGAQLLSGKALGPLVEETVERYRRLRSLRLPYLFAVAPMKERVYADFLPEGAALAKGTAVRRLNAALRPLNGGEALDLLPALREGRRSGEVYSRTDSEWNDRGAFYAYRALMKEAVKRVAALDDPLLPEEAPFSPKSGFSGNLAGKPKVELAAGGFEPVEAGSDWTEDAEVLDVSGLASMRMPAPPHLEVTPGRAPHLYEVPGRPDLPRAALVGDACCLALIPWLAEHFSRFVFLWTTEPPLEALELEMPDVILHVVSERTLVHGP